MEKGLLFFTLSIACLWVILDEFFGSKKLSTIVDNLTPDFGNPIEDFIKGTKTMEEKKQDQKDLKDSIDESEDIKSDKVKDKLKDAVDDFYIKNGVEQEA